MNRLVSILALISLLFSALAANPGGQLLCSHDEGPGHVVDYSAHEKAHSDPCRNETESQNGDASHRIGNHDHETNCDYQEQACDDVEIPQPDFRDRGQSGDRQIVKSPAIHFCLTAVFANAIDRQTDTWIQPIFRAPPLQSASRNFAKTIQIRC